MSLSSLKSVDTTQPVRKTKYYREGLVTLVKYLRSCRNCFAAFEPPISRCRVAYHIRAVKQLVAKFEDALGTQFMEK